MPIFPFLLVILSASLHALWNFATKKVSGNICVLYIGLLLACIIYLPFALALSLSDFFIPAAYPYIFATGIIHAVYFFTLSKAYNYGDISTVYPIARGTGIAGTAVAASIFLQETISLFGIIGIVSITLGIFLIGFKHGEQMHHYKGLFYALVVGITIVGYSIVDKQAVGITNPIAYMYGLVVLTTLFLTPYIMTKERAALKNAWRKFKIYSLIIGVGSIGTYLIVLFVFQLARVSYVVAARELAVAIGALLGFRFLHEQYSTKKILGIICIVFGLIMIKIA